MDFKAIALIRLGEILTDGKGRSFRIRHFAINFYLPVAIFHLVVLPHKTGCLMAADTTALVGPISRVLSEQLVHRGEAAGQSGSVDDHVLQTGPCDWIMSPAMSLAMIWFFPMPLARNCADFMPCLRMISALERLLTHYPWAAGRFVVGEKGRVNIHGMDRGVPFVIAETDCCISDLPLSVEQYTNTRLIPASLKLVSEMDFSNPINTPPLQVQHTRMACGGVALGIRMSHILVDGDALFSFVRDWAELYTTGGSELCVPPSLDRTWTIPSDEEILQRAGSYEEHVLTLNPPNSPSPAASDPSILRVFRFSRAQLTQLKEEATSSGSWVSTYEALTAWLLQRAYHARVAVGAIPESELDNPMKLVFACNWRARLRDPPTPAKYWGNGAIQLAMLLPLRELLNNSLRVNAARVHAAVEMATSERIRNSFAFIASQSDATKIAFNINTGHDMASTSWIRMGMYRVQFDGAGPLRICLPYFLGYDGVMMLHSTPGAEPGTEDAEPDVDVYFGLTEAAMEKVEADPEWKRVRII